MRVLFWGTPEFATPALRALIGEGFEVVGVVTQPDRAIRRSRSALEAPPVKQIAMGEGIPVLQPERPRDENFLRRIEELTPEISVVVAYGHILTQRIIDLPRLGTINVHASLLPKLRGAAPIQAAIREGHGETGISIMRMVQKLDAGPVILRMRTPIPEDETYGELQLRLAEMGALALIEGLALIEVGAATEEPQDDAAATYAPKVEREMARVHWTRDAAEVARAIRACDPRPGAFASMRNTEVKLFGAHLAPRIGGARAGDVLEVSANGLVVACGTGAVRIMAVQPSGKRRMSPAEWARGRGIAPGDQLS